MALSRDQNPTHNLLLPRLTRCCPACGSTTWTRFYDSRTIAFPKHNLQFNLPSYRCQRPDCRLFKKPYRSELIGRFAPAYSRYSYEFILTIGSLSDRPFGRTSFHQFLAERNIHVPLRTLPSLIDRYQSLRRGLYTDATLNQLFIDQGCAILDIFMVGSPWRKGSYWWIVQEFLSSSPLKIMPFDKSNAINVRKLITDVAFHMPVPVIGFVLSEGLWNEIAVYYLLINSGKGPSRSCVIPRQKAFEESEVMQALVQMIREFHEDRCENGNRRKKMRMSEPPFRFLYQEYIGNEPLQPKIVPLTMRHKDRLMSGIRDWLSSPAALFREYSDYEYWWDLLDFSIEIL